MDGIVSLMEQNGSNPFSTRWYNMLEIGMLMLL